MSLETKPAGSLRTYALVSLVTSLVITGCAAAPDEGSPPGGGGSGSGTTTEPNGPRILSFAANRTTLDSPGDDVVLSVVVTDGDGVDDVIGGTLFVDGTSASLGTFATSAQEGAYSLTVTWADMMDPLPEDYAPWGEDLALPLRAEFFDQAGHKATQVISVKLTCDNTDAERFRVADIGCEVGTTCRAVTINGEYREECESVREVTTGEQMCQRAFGHACVRCDDNDSCTDETAYLNCDCV